MQFDDNEEEEEDENWFSLPDDPGIFSQAHSRAHSELSFSANGSFNPSLASDMSDITHRDEEMDDEGTGWRRSSMEPRSDIGPPPRPHVQELVFTRYPRFLNPDYFDFKTGEEKPSAVELRNQISESDREKSYFESQFIVIKPLGSGSSADAYKVQHRRNANSFAVKVTRHPYNGIKSRSKHLTEVETMWDVGIHPHIVQLVDAWEQRGHLHLQMELCAGGNLAAYLEESAERGFDEIRIWRMLGEVASGLEHIHSKDIIHLDIKPANIFIGHPWKLMIGDFGLATKLPVVCFFAGIKNLETVADPSFPCSLALRNKTWNERAIESILPAKSYPETTASPPTSSRSAS